MIQVKRQQKTDKQQTWEKSQFFPDVVTFGLPKNDTPGNLGNHFVHQNCHNRRETVQFMVLIHHMCSSPYLQDFKEKKTRMSKTF